MSPQIEFSRRIVVDPWPEDGVAVEVAADPSERHALAERFGLLELHSLEGRGRLERRGDRPEIVLRGSLDAEVVQACVVSLEPVAATIRQPIERRYRFDDATERSAWLEPQGAVELDDEAEVEPIAGRAIDVGEAFAEELGLALDPYPRAAEADTLVTRDLGPYIRYGPAEPQRPFAILRQLQQEKSAR